MRRRAGEGSPGKARPQPGLGCMSFRRAHVGAAAPAAATLTAKAATGEADSA